MLQTTSYLGSEYTMCNGNRDYKTSNMKILWTNLMLIFGDKPQVKSFAILERIKNLKNYEIQYVTITLPANTFPNVLEGM